MKKIVTTTLILIANLQLLAGEITICESGCDQSSISEGINSSNPYDTLIIRGMLRENGIVVDKPITILGQDYPVVDAEYKGEIFRIESDSVVVSGLDLRNVGVSYVKDHAAINIVNCTGCIVIDNKLINTFFGIYLQKSDNCIISNNQIIGEAQVEMSSGNAIHLWYCNKIEIRENLCQQHRDGIYLEFVDSSRVESNISKHNIRYGLHFMFSNYDEYLHNTFEENGSGVAVMFSKHILMKENDFINNWGRSSYGLLLKDITDSQIHRNNFVKNTTGIYAESAIRIDMGYNTFKNNGWAIRMLGSSMYNEFHDNDLVGNTIDLTTNSVRNTNNYYENYWSGYNGYDLDKDGFGDVPHKLIQLYSHILSQVPEAIVLVRSPLVDLLNFVENTTPVFTPEGLEDIHPSMYPVNTIASNDPD